MEPYAVPHQPEQLDRLKAALADRYRIERELGHGGMATVYLAEDRKHERLVAVKVLRPELVAVIGPERFLREIKLTARLSHPHILPLLDSGEADGVLYYGPSSRSTTHSCSASRWPPRSTTPIGRASSTEISNPRTSCCTPAKRWWRISGLPWRSVRQVATG